MTQTAHSLYPVQEPFETGSIAVGDGHVLYYARYGNPGGEPFVYLHGGPGGGCKYDEYRYFDPAHYCVILYDQRGSGRSTPYASTVNNNVPALVRDLEKLREKFGYQDWNVTGGSFGSTLGMFYAVMHPERVRRLMLRGIFFGDADGAHNLINADGLLKRCRNEWFQAYHDHIPAAERMGGLAIPYYNRLMSADENVAVEAARLFMRYDRAIATMHPQLDALEKINEKPRAMLAISRLFFHFSVNEFMKNDYKTFLLNGMKKLTMPVDILHGRQDWICPVENALELHKHCPQARLEIIENTGHGMVEPGLQQAFIRTTDSWARRTSGR